ncbi:hypothetical protein D6D28_06485 [Aureobasidium pullulans]|uniref:Uncharacterized protein n=1 Tax=Aureobasidium pullulans TaxID=5580 RepID=A0A4S8SDU8_AURPU|nr:hypothetical protein D6D28_06485 [Aureobasidium pullulans]
MSLTLERRPPASGNKQILRFPSAPSSPPWPPPTWPPSRGLVLSRSKSTERVTASDIESDDDDQQHTNGASVPVQALDREANGVPLDATGIGGKRIAQRRVYGPQPYSLRQWQHELRYEEDRLSSRHLLSHMPFSLLTLFSF